MFCEDMIPETELLIKSNITDNVICRSLKDSLDCLQKCVDNHTEYKRYMQSPDEDNAIIAESQIKEGDYDDGEEENEIKDEHHHHTSSTTSFQHDKPLINLGVYEATILSKISAKDIINRLTGPARHGVAFLCGELSEYRWSEIIDKLKSLWKPSTIKPIMLERHLGLGPKQVDELMITSGFFCRAEHYINFDNYKKLLNAVDMLSNPDFYATALRIFDISVPRMDYPSSSSSSSSDDIIGIGDYRDDDNNGYSSNSNKHHHQQQQHRSPTENNLIKASPRSQPHQQPLTVSSGITHRAPDGTLREHDNATPFLLIRNLPLDVTTNELLILLRKTSGCGYLDNKDVIIPPSHRQFKDPAAQAKAEAIGGHAYVNFQHIKDARLVRNELNSKMFGGRALEIEYSLGRPNRSVWIGAVPAELTQEQIERCMQRYGPVQRIDLRRRKFAGDAFAFAVYDRIEDAIEAVKSMAELGNLIEGHKVRIGFSSSSVDQNLSTATSSAGNVSMVNGSGSARDSGRESDYGRRDRDTRKERGGVRVNRDSNGRDDYEPELSSPRDMIPMRQGDRNDNGYISQAYRERYLGRERDSGRDRDRDSRDRDAGPGALSGGTGASGVLKDPYEYEQSRYLNSRDRYTTTASSAAALPMSGYGRPVTAVGGGGSTVDHDRLDLTDNMASSKSRWDHNRSGPTDSRRVHSGQPDSSTGNYPPLDMHKKEYRGGPINDDDYDYYNEGQGSSSRIPVPISGGGFGYRRPSYHQQSASLSAYDGVNSNHNSYNELPVVKRRISSDNSYDNNYPADTNIDDDRDYKRGRSSATAGGGGGGGSSNYADDSRYHSVAVTESAASYRQHRGGLPSNSGGYNITATTNNNNSYSDQVRVRSPISTGYPEYGQERNHNKHQLYNQQQEPSSNRVLSHGYNNSGNNNQQQQLQHASLQGASRNAPPSNYYNR